MAACGGYYSSQIDPAELLATHAANARLISAVPDMLAALERVMTLQISAGGDEVFADVKAAIAKARGQS